MKIIVIENMTLTMNVSIKIQLYPKNKMIRLLRIKINRSLKIMMNLNRPMNIIMILYKL